jgi:hypothetical protein
MRERGAVLTTVLRLLRCMRAKTGNTNSAFRKNIK